MLSKLLVVGEDRTARRESGGGRGMGWKNNLTFLPISQKDIPDTNVLLLDQLKYTFHQTSKVLSTHQSVFK